MSIKFDLTGPEYLKVDQNLVGSDIFTWAAWFKLETVDGVLDQDILWSGDGDVGQDDGYHRLQYEGGNNDLKFNFRNGTTNFAITTTGFTLGEWHHCLAFRSSSTNAEVFLNGDEGGSGQNTTSVTGTNARTNRFSIGMARDATPTDPNNGQIAHVAVWNIALTNAEDRAALAAGLPPWMIHPEALIRYFPLNDILDLKDHVSGVALTAFNTPVTGVDSPPVIMPRTELILPFGAVFVPPVPIVEIANSPTVDAVASDTSITVTHGMTFSDKDVIIVTFHSNNLGLDLTAPAGKGFTRDFTEDGDKTDTYAIFSKVSNGTEDLSWTFDSDGGATSMSIIVRAFSGVDAAVWDVAPSASTRTKSGTDSTTGTAPTMTTLTDGALGFAFIVTDTTTMGYNSPTNGYGNEAEEAVSRPQASYTKTWSTAGATGTVSVTLEATQDWVMHQFALKREVIVANDITASLQKVLTVSANLNAPGALTGSQLLTLTTVADLAGSGNLQLAASLVLTLAADLKSAGNLQAAASLILTLAADLKAQGKLDIATGLVLTVAADLRAQGKLDAAAALVLTVAADLNSASNINVTMPLVLTVAADLRSQGLLTVSALTVLTVAADLNATGALSESASLVLTVAANLSSPNSVDMTANLPVVLTVAAALKATGDVAAAAALILTLVTDLKAQGSLIATHALVLSAIAPLIASGALTANMATVLSTAADLKGQGNLTASAALVLTVAADLTTGVSPILAALQLTLSTNTVLTAPGSLTAANSMLLSVNATLDDGTVIIVPSRGGDSSKKGKKARLLMPDEQLDRQIKREDKEILEVIKTAMEIME